MDSDLILMDVEEHFEKSLKALDNEFRRIRTGRASPAMIEHVVADAYGAPTPINQLAGISVPEPSQLLIKPWDKGVLKEIEKALIASDLGMSPQNDGEQIRLNVPPLSSERRQQLAAQAKESSEKCKIAMRNTRRDGIKRIETEGKESNESEDTIRQLSDQVTELLKTYEAKAEAALIEKTEDITTV